MRKRHTCRHCGQPIEPCNCGAYGGLHWQSVTARSGQGSLYCGPGQRHEPAEPDPSVGQR